MAVANNTVAILICGDLFKEISEIEGINPKRSASLLDIFACVAQGIIPYGAQILLASQIAKLSPLEVAGKVYYCYLLAFVVLINIFFQKNRPKTT
jgi:Na+/H+ antiporter NhaC